MKCSCSSCGGTGQIQCPECGGDGMEEKSIERVALRKNDKHYDELMELQGDATRVIDQAMRLNVLKPERSKSYNEQLRGCLAVINRQADLLKEKSK